MTLKKQYEAPEMELISFCMSSVLRDVIHTSPEFERGGQNRGWTFNDDGDDYFEDLLP